MSAATGGGDASPMIVIDGSEGEGGGQILRSSMALAAITGKSVRIINIRAKRPKPGLARQHLVAVQAAATISKGRLEGDALNSTELTFYPGPAKISGGEFEFDIGSAGSVVARPSSAVGLWPALHFITNA